MQRGFSTKEKQNRFVNSSRRVKYKFNSISFHLSNYQDVLQLLIHFEMVIWRIFRQFLKQWFKMEIQSQIFLWETAVGVKILIEGYCTDFSQFLIKRQSRLRNRDPYSRSSERPVKTVHVASPSLEIPSKKLKATNNKKKRKYSMSSTLEIQLFSQCTYTKVFNTISCYLIQFFHAHIITIKY